MSTLDLVALRFSLGGFILQVRCALGFYDEVIFTLIAGLEAFPFEDKAKVGAIFPYRRGYLVKVRQFEKADHLVIVIGIQGKLLLRLAVNPLRHLLIYFSGIELARYLGDC